MRIAKLLAKTDMTYKEQLCDTQIIDIRGAHFASSVITDEMVPMTREEVTKHERV